VRRGEVYRFRIPKGAVHEQQGARYAVVVQADELLPRSVVIVAPTSQSARPASFRPAVRIARQDTRVLVEQVGAVDAQRLARRAGQLTADEMWAVDEALMTVLGLV
jgi:mRNA interferase MazF